MASTNISLLLNALIFLLLIVSLSNIRYHWDVRRVIWQNFSVQRGSTECCTETYFCRKTSIFFRMSITNVILRSAKLIAIHRRFTKTKTLMQLITVNLIANVVRCLNCFSVKTKISSKCCTQSYSSSSGVLPNTV